MFKQGAIVLIPFPFTDLTAVKVRPAIVLSKKVLDNDIIVCFISSKKPRRLAPADIFIKKTERDFEKTGLKVDSVVRVGKIATLDKKIVLGELGEVNTTTRKNINNKLKFVLGI